MSEPSGAWRGDRASGPARLSLAALRYGARLRSIDAGALADRLYWYHSVPAGAPWRRTLADPTDVRRFLHLTSSPLGLRRDWTEHGGSGQGWLHWQRRGRQASPARVVYKVYVSPVLPALADALHVLLGSVNALPVAALKVGLAGPTLLRSDRLIAYCSARKDLAVVARAWRKELVGLPAHGVPFTCALTADGLLSWGADPPRARRRPAASWRMLVTRVLALGLHRAFDDPHPNEPPEDRALAELPRVGVDPERFAPLPTFGA